MKLIVRALVSVLLCMGFASQALAGPSPSIEVKIDGTAAHLVNVELIHQEVAAQVMLCEDRGSYFAEALPGSYTLTLSDKDYGTVLLVESMTISAEGEGASRHINCSHHDGSIACRNYF